MRNLLLVLLLASIACVAPASIGSTSSASVFQTPYAPNTDSGDSIQAVVLADSLNVRKCASYNCASIGIWKQKGDLVTIYEELDNWCNIGGGQWVACWWLEIK